MELSAPRVQIVKNNQIFVDGKRVGYMIFDKTLGITKEYFLNLWGGSRPITKIMEAVPPGYVFNYYWLHRFELDLEYQGKGLGSLILATWFASLKSPACVGLQPSGIANVPTASVKRFYAANNFQFFRSGSNTYGLTFVKAKRT